MERAKKMVLISKDQLDRIQREKNGEPRVQLPAAQPADPSDVLPVLHSTQTIGDNLSRLDNDMKQILDLNRYKDEPTRLKEYLRVLQRYLFFTDQKRQISYPKTEITDLNSLSDDLIIESLPKLHQKKAQLLLKHLKANPKSIRWNEKGTVYIDDEKIVGSNIIDLINDASRSRKNVKAIGRREFATVLREIDTPREYIGNTDLLNVTSSSEKRKKFYESDDDGENFLSLKDSRQDFSGTTNNSFASLVDETLLENYSTPKISRSQRGKTPRKSPQNNQSPTWLGLNNKKK